MAYSTSPSPLHDVAPNAPVLVSVSKPAGSAEPASAPTQPRRNYNGLFLVPASPKPRDTQALAFDIVAEVESRIQRRGGKSRFGDLQYNAFFQPERETPSVIARRILRGLLSLAHIA